MRRDFVCLARLLIDSFPQRLRNSRPLFLLLRGILGVPDYFYYFRADYRHSPFPVEQLYTPGSSKYSKRLSPVSDLNSFHIKEILAIAQELKPASVLDLGCGSGYMLKQLRNALPNTTALVGVDCDAAPAFQHYFQYIQTNLESFATAQEDQSFDLVICTHTLEHIPNPRFVCEQMRRICRLGYIIVCPLEKEFQWGLNYHINFYETQKDYIESLGIEKSISHFSRRLGDIMSFTRLSV